MNVFQESRPRWTTYHWTCPRASHPNLRRTRVGRTTGRATATVWRPRTEWRRTNATDSGFWTLVLSESVSAQRVNDPTSDTTWSYLLKKLKINLPVNRIFFFFNFRWNKLILYFLYLVYIYYVYVYFEVYFLMCWYAAEKSFPANENITYRWKIVFMPFTLYKNAVCLSNIITHYFKRVMAYLNLGRKHDNTMPYGLKCYLFPILWTHRSRGVQQERYMKMGEYFYIVSAKPLNETRINR